MIPTLKHIAAALTISAVVLCASASEQTSRPSGEPTTQSAATELSKRLVGPSDSRKIEDRPISPWSQWGRTLGALALVVVLIFVARMMLKRFGPVSGAGSRVLDVLASSTVSPRQQLLLVRVGRRVVLVGRSPAAMATLSEVTDPEEVAELVEAASAGGLKKIADNAKAREDDA